MRKLKSISAMLPVPVATRLADADGVREIDRVTREIKQAHPWAFRADPLPTSGRAARMTPTPVAPATVVRKSHDTK